MVMLLTMIFAVAPWFGSAADSNHVPAVSSPPELCSRAKTRSPERLAAARELQLKSTNDPLRLQTDVQHYRLELAVDPSAAFIDGRTTMTVACAEDDVTAFRFWLHSALVIDEVLVDGRVAAWRRLDDATVEVDLAGSHDAGEVFELVVGYEGFPITSGLSSIVFANQGGSPVVATLSEPWFAYTWWPVKEDNRDKATGELMITVPNDLTVAANGVFLGTNPAAGGRRLFRWSTDYPTSPYLFAFSATRYNTFSDVFTYDGGSMPVEFFIWPGSDTPANRTAWRRSVEMLGTFSELFGLYPFIDEKYAIYQFPWGGGMEHQTATGQGGNSAFSESLTAHELGHQWWGDSVTCATWSDIWLNEGFATYAAALWFEFQSGLSDQEALRSFMLQSRPDELDEAIYIPDPTDVSRIFSGDYSYRKGAWVLHMLRGVVETETFFEILEAYRDRFEFSTATTEDFRQVAEEVWGGDLQWFFDEWVYGGGAPAYAYGWREHEIAGRRYLEISVEQTQGEGAFSMPLEIEIDEGGQRHRATVWNSGTTGHYMLPVAGPVQALDLDPDSWILTRSVTQAAFVDGPPKVVAFGPSPGTLLRAGDPLSLSVLFQEDVEIEASDVVLVRDGGASYDVSVTYDSGARAAVITTDRPLAGGRYQLTIRDTVVDIQGLALDGEVGAQQGVEPLPSGDGVPGGDAVLSFNVTGTRGPSRRAHPPG